MTLRQCTIGLFALMAVSITAGCTEYSQTSNGSTFVPSDHKHVLILTAASTTAAVEHVARKFEQKFGTKVEISSGASNALAQQILAGAPADIFLSANEKWADEVTQHGFARDIQPLLTNQLVIVVPLHNPANIHTPHDLVNDEMHRIALAGENVPAGMYADQALKSLGLFSRLSDAGKIVRGQDVRVAFRYVEQNEADAGIVYATDAIASKNCQVVYTFEPDAHDPVIYAAVLIRREAENPEGKMFFDYLFSEEAISIFRERGFAPMSTLVSQPSPDSKEH